MPPIYIGSSLAKLCVGAQIVSAVYIGSVQAYSANTDPIAPTNITLSASSVSESASVGTVVGLLGSNGYPASTYSKILDAGSKFSVVGNELRIAAALDYETATSHSVTIRATNASGSYDKIFAASVTNTTELPTNTVAPSISGSPTQGGTLTGSDGTWTSAAGAISYVRAWLRDGIAISAATGSTYVLDAADVGAMIGYRVTATNSDGSTQTTSATVGPVDAASVFDPLSLFAAGQKGAWYDIGDLTTLYQDTAGTVPVTAAGQNVLRINDKSGNGAHQILTAAIALAQDGDGAYYLQGNGTIKGETAAAVNLSSTDKLTAIVSCSADVATGQRGVFSYGKINTNTGGFELHFISGRPGAYIRGSGEFAYRSHEVLRLGKSVYSSEFDLSGTTYSTEHPVYRESGEDYEPMLTSSGTGAGGGNFGSTYKIAIMGGYSASFAGKFYGALVVAGLVGPVDLRKTESVMASKSGLALQGSDLAYSITPTAFTDSYASINRYSYLESSAYSAVEIATTATSLDVTAYNNIYGTFPNYAETAVYVDGVYSQKLEHTAAGRKMDRVTLSAGAKNVQLVAGLQSRPNLSNPVIGTFVTHVAGNAAITQTFTTPIDRIVLIADSIGVGANSDAPNTEGWALKLRALRSGKSTMLESYGFRSLWDDCQDSTKRAALVARIVTLAPAKLYIALGTNDYGLSKWNAAGFGTAYAALLDDLHAAMPSLVVWCQTPIVRSVETQLTAGYGTLSDYRTQINTVSAARSSYCNLVDGTAIVTTGDLADGVHPTTAGHAKYYDYVRVLPGLI